MDGGKEGKPEGGTEGRREGERVGVRHFVSQNLDVEGDPDLDGTLTYFFGRQRRKLGAGLH